MGLGRRHWIRPAGSPPAGIGDWERGSRCATARENLPRITSPYANLRILDKMWSGLVWDHLAVEPAMEPDQGGGDVWWCGGGPVMLARCWEGVWSMRQTISSTQHTGSHHTRAGSAGCKAPPRRGRRGRLVECWRSIDRSRASCSGQTCKRGRGRGQLGKGCGPRRRDRPMGADS